VFDYHNDSGKSSLEQASSEGFLFMTKPQLGKISAGIVEIKKVDGFTAGTAVWSEVPSGFFRLHIAQPLQDMIPRLPLAYWLPSGNRQQWVREHRQARGREVRIVHHHESLDPTFEGKNCLFCEQTC
jgi:hypothetical protein